MAGGNFQYSLAVFNSGSQLLHETLIKPDWLPALEAARFQALCSVGSISGKETISPSWHPSCGQPYISGVRACVNVGSNGEGAIDIPMTYFRPHADAVVTALVQSGALVEGEQILYSVSAFLVPDEPVTEKLSYGSLSVERQCPLRGARSIAEFECNIKATIGSGGANFPVFIPKAILDEAEALKEGAGDVETGGIVIGHLWQDPAAGPFVVVTAFIPARHTLAEKTRLTFTPETWADVNAAINLRAAGESYVGWIHTHPCRVWCHCPEPEKKVNCGYSLDFFSTTDAYLHRCVFYGAHQIAVVLGDRFLSGEGWKTTYSGYGWDHGIIVSRQFYITDGSVERQSFEKRETNGKTTAG